MKEKIRQLEKELQELRAAYDALKVDKEKYLLFFDSSFDFLYCHDPGGNLLDANASISRVFGWEKEDILNRNLRDLLGGDAAERVGRYLEILDSRGEAQGVIQLADKSGHLRSIEYQSTLVGGQGGGCVLGVGRDTTDRDRIEEELPKLRDFLEDMVEDRARELMAANEMLRLEIDKRMLAEEDLYRIREESREMYEDSQRFEEFNRSLLHASADAIVILDLKGRTRYVSPSFTRIFGWTREELQGKNIPFVPPDEKPTTRDIIERLIEREKPLQNVVTRRMTREGRLLDVSLSASRVEDLENLPSGVLVVLRDVTEVRRMEVQLQHAQKMESIGTIASGVAHNFRNILAGISVDSQLLQIKHGKDPSIEEITGRMNRYVKRGTSLVEGLMQFARKPRDRGFGKVDLASILRDTRDLIAQSFAGNILIECSLPDSLMVLGDDNGLQQVFMNLCTNARDAMPDGGTLGIRAEGRGEWAEVEITDTGEGMSQETRQRCFDPFFTTKGVHKGTGLGLSTSYNIVKGHGGEITLRSAPGQGTTFLVHLPIHNEETVDEPAGEKLWAPVPGNGRTVLVVDDEEGMLKALEDLLESLGYVPVIASNGKDAVEAFKAHRPDAVILDRNIPGKDGIACLREIMELDAAARVILISGYDQEGPNGIDHETRKSIAGYLTKPLDVGELSHVLARLFK